MRASAVLHTTFQQLRRPRTWGAALLFGLVWNGARVLLGGPEPGPVEALVPVLWVALFMVLVPLPWQWTGDDAPMASVLRGAAQALPWMAALTLGLLLLLGSAAPQVLPGRGMGPGMGPGMSMMERPLAGDPSPALAAGAGALLLRAAAGLDPGGPRAG